jgi:hypothetical protein
VGKGKVLLNRKPNSAPANPPRTEGVKAAKVAWLLVLTTTFFTIACQPANTPRAVVDRFIEAHYLAMNLKSSERWCTGLALEKLHQEEALTAGQAIEEDTRKPLIHYRLQDQHDGKDRVMYLFLATIDVPDGGSFDKKWMITARKEGAIWKVSNFIEYD